MWFSTLAYLLISGILTQTISGICPNFKYCSLLVSFVLMIILGFCGNSIFKAELKWKIKQGYHLSKDFSPTSLRSLVLISLIAGVANAVITKALMPAVSGFSEGLGSNNNPMQKMLLVMYLIDIIIYGAAFLYEYCTYKNENVEPKIDDINQYLEKEGDDISIIAAIAYYFIIVVLVGFIVPIVAVTSMRMIGKKIENQLATIADKIDNEGKQSALNVEEKIISDVNAIADSKI